MSGYPPYPTGTAMPMPEPPPPPYSAAGSAPSYPFSPPPGPPITTGYPNVNPPYNYNQNQPYGMQQQQQQQPPPPQYNQPPYQPSGMAPPQSQGYPGYQYPAGASAPAPYVSPPVQPQPQLNYSLYTQSSAMMNDDVEELQAGEIVQLISRASGRAVQVMKISTGQLVLDAQGGIGPEFKNAHFTVIREPEDVVIFHNNFNFIGLQNGQLMVIPIGNPNQPPPPICRFYMFKPEPKQYAFESCMQEDVFISFHSNGEPKPGFNVENNDGLFGVQVGYTPGGNGQRY